jgi:integrase
MATQPLTAQRIQRATCPYGKTQAMLWDAVQPGLVLRIYPSGAKTFFVFYRVGSGRKATQRWDKIGNALAISLQDARDAARARLGAVAKGGDPAGERRAESRRRRERLEPALAGYAADLERRQVVKRKDVLSLLRRELSGALGNLELAELDRNTIVQRIAEIERSGRPGAAQDLRKNASVFLGWAADTGLITASPLAGWRRARRTRAEQIDRSGRALADWELSIFWRAAGEDWPFGPYLKMLLLLGQRRTETALMSWCDVDLEAGVWILPPEITKSGRPHKIPLPPQAVAILRGLPRLAKSDLVFPGRHGRAMTGWSKRLPAIYEATAAAGMAPWTPHDCRRTMRTGLGQLGVDRVVAELLLDHAVSDELAKIYDRGEYWHLRTEAAARWGAHVLGLIGGGSAAVPIRRGAQVSAP